MNTPHWQIAHQLSKNPMRVPVVDGDYSPAFIEFLQLVYTDEEAEVIRHLEVMPGFLTIDQVAEASGLPAEEVGTRLNGAHQKNALIGMGEFFCLPPIPILFNIHHFYEEVREGDLETIAPYRKFFIDEKYHRYYETSEAGTPVFRAIPVGEAIRCGQEKLDTEEATRFLSTLDTEDFVLTACPCRTRAEKAGDRECKDKFPIGSCIMLGTSALHFEMVGVGRRVTREQAISYMKEMNELGLVICTDNAKAKNSIVCLCCDCCCSQVRGRTRWDHPDAIAPSNFIPKADENCIGCGKCTSRCFFGALSVDKTVEKKKRRVEINPELCIGCGVCTFACKTGALQLERHERSEPFSSTGRLMKTFEQENAPSPVKDTVNV